LEACQPTEQRSLPVFQRERQDLRCTTQAISEFGGMLWAGEQEWKMERIPGAIPYVLSAKDNEGKEYACPSGSLMNPNIVSQEEKDNCEPMSECSVDQ
jgi:hypothetical protein